MTTAAAESLAKATLHLRIIRQNGEIEERDVPVETTLTKAEVQILIARAPKVGA